MTNETTSFLSGYSHPIKIPKFEKNIIQALKPSMTCSLYSKLEELVKKDSRSLSEQSICYTMLYINESRKVLDETCPIDRIEESAYPYIFNIEGCIDKSNKYSIKIGLNLHTPVSDMTEWSVGLNTYLKLKFPVTPKWKSELEDEIGEYIKNNQLIGESNDKTRLYGGFFGADTFDLGPIYRLKGLAELVEKVEEGK